MKNLLVSLFIALAITGCGDGGSVNSSKSSIPQSQLEYQKKYIKAHSELISTKMYTREREEKAKEMDAFLKSLVGTKVDKWVCKYNGGKRNPKTLAESNDTYYDPNVILNLDHNGVQMKVVSVNCSEDNVKFKSSEGKMINAGFTLYLSLEQAKLSEELFHGDLLEINGESIEASLNGWDWGYEGMKLINASYKILKKAN